MKLRTIIKIILCVLVPLVAFCLGFALSELRSSDQTEKMVSFQQPDQTDQIDDFHQFVYAYDTEQKLENYYKIHEEQFFDKTGFPPESSESREFMAMVRENGRPLVVVGPFSVFVKDDGTFSVREMQIQTGSISPLVELRIHEQSKYLTLFSSYEKGLRLPRFNAILRYSEDGIYKKGGFYISGEDGMPVRSYFDTRGVVVFDVMHVFENGNENTYHLNGLSWEKVTEQ